MSEQAIRRAQHRGGGGVGSVGWPYAMSFAFAA